MNSAAPITQEKTVFDVLRDVWRAKIYIFVGVIMALVLAFVFLGFAKPHYRAEILLAPAMPLGQSALRSDIMGEGSAQISSKEQQSSKYFLQFEHIYAGPRLASFLLDDKEVMALLSGDMAFEVSNPEQDWTAEKLSSYLHKRVHFENVSGTPLKRLVYLHPSADAAKYMVSRVHELADEMIRASVLQETNERIKYLNASLSQNSNPDHRRTLTALLMEQERIKMMVSLDQAFAATVVEPAYVSSKPRWPDPYFITFIFVFVGALSGFVVYGLRHHG